VPADESDTPISFASMASPLFFGKLHPTGSFDTFGSELLPQLVLQHIYASALMHRQPAMSYVCSPTGRLSQVLRC